MASTVSKPREPQDLRRVGVEEEWEVQWWAVRFRVTPAQLREAVREHGDDAETIEQRLKEAARKSFNNMGED